MKEYIVFDIENNTKSGLRKAGHFLYDDIVAFALKNQYEIYSDYVYPGKLHKLMIDECVIVGHHLQHDLLFVWPLLQDFFKFGGEIWDTQVVEYLLSGQTKNLRVKEEHHPLALRTMSIMYGCEKREKFMESYWEKGFQTSEIPKELVLKDVENDVLDTEKIYLQQVKICERKGLLPLIKGYMDGLLGLCEIEFNGAFINKDILETNKLKLQVELNEVEKNLLLLINEHWHL